MFKRDLCASLRARILTHNLAILSWKSIFYTEQEAALFLAPPKHLCTQPPDSACPTRCVGYDDCRTPATVAGREAIQEMAAQMRRLLVYQPNHGLAVEVHMLEIAMHLGEILDRTVVLPRLPILETTNYEEGLEYYFNIPRSFSWSPNAEFIRERHGVVDVLYHVIPDYSPYYRSAAVREIHPVWLDDIEHYRYFGSLGMTIRQVVTRQILHQLDTEAVQRVFATDAPVIGITYINGLLDEKTRPRSCGEDNFAQHRSVPTGPNNHFVALASSFIDGREYDAIHWRRSKTLIQMARRFMKLRLPSLASLCDHIGPHCQRLFLATDAPRIGGLPVNRGIEIFRYHCDSPNENAVMDLTLCVLADHFVGTEVSTFSHLISRLRHKAGKAADSTVVLPSLVQDGQAP